MRNKGIVRRGRAVLSLRDAAVRADPDGALDVARPVLLDEWQLVSEVLAAVKRAVDARPGPNNFLITGSVRSDLEGEGWPMTGRVLRVQMYGLTEREITGDARAVPILDRLAAQGVGAFSLPQNPPSLSVRRDGNLLGRLLDTFVMAQLRTEAIISKAEPGLYHVRSEQGRHEVDIVVEYAGGGMFGFEVKASGGPSLDDAKHLQWLRDELGDRFIGGAVLHSGPRLYPLTERIVAAPICSLWA